jgi:hypothetical protein
LICPLTKHYFLPGRCLFVKVVASKEVFELDNLCVDCIALPKEEKIADEEMNQILE